MGSLNSNFVNLYASYFLFLDNLSIASFIKLEKIFSFFVFFNNSLLNSPNNEIISSPELYSLCP